MPHVFTQTANKAVSNLLLIPHSWNKGNLSLRDGKVQGMGGSARG